MRFEIDHRTRYSYSGPVKLGHHLIRMHPSNSGYQRPVAHKLVIDPEPSLMTENLDTWGNRVSEVWFDGETRHLDIRVSLTVDTLRPNASDFRLAPYPLSLPLDYGDDASALHPCLVPVHDETSVADFVAPLLASHRNDPSAFLDALNACIHGFYRHGLRLDGPARGPAETIRRQEGVCRDLTVLFMAACRSAGIAARFVSGYQKGDSSRQVRYLHAWPEVYLPGGGWRGYDPTHNARVTDAHVAVAHAGNPEGAAPITGSFDRGPDPVETTLDTEVHIATDG